MTPEITVAGHVCVDLIPQMTSSTGIEPGLLINVGPASFATGGAVANTGIALHRMGLPVMLMGKVGDDFFGEIIQSIFDKAEVNSNLIAQAGEATSYSVVISPPGSDRTFLHCPGANDTFYPSDIDLDSVRGSRLFHFGYPPLMRSTFVDGGSDFSTMMQKISAMGVVTTLDMARPDPDSEAGRVDWERFLTLALPHTDVFLPSVDELLYMIDRKRFQEMEDGASLEALGGTGLLEQLAGRLITMGTAMVVMKLGEEGLYLKTTDDSSRLRAMAETLDLNPEAWAGKELRTNCYEVDVAGTTGAGDCTIAGFIAALAKGLLPEDALEAAVGTGACSVEAHDATSGVPAWDTILQRIEKGWRKRKEPQ